MFFLPTTVTPFPCFTMLSSAACFCFLTLPTPLFFANLSTLFSRASRWRFLVLRSFVRRARFSMGVNSLRARSEEDGAANTSSGASIVDVDLVVGRADSRVAVAVLVTVEIIALAWSRSNEKNQKWKLKQNSKPVWVHNARYTGRLVCRIYLPREH